MPTSPFAKAEVVDQQRMAEAGILFPKD
eukprot:COSAG04_NODE_13969_length_585_cov_0.940329_1_plen_27_part_10